MSTLQQLRAQFYQTIEETETDSHFSAEEANGLLNQAIPLIAGVIHYPRDLVGVQVEENIPAYTPPSDFLYLRTAYFGDTSIVRDVRPLKVYKEETLKEIEPSWLNENADTAGRPDKLMLLDRHTLLIHPFPNAEHSAAGKRLIIGYVFIPNKLTSDSSEPDFPLIYHDCIQFYAAGLAYVGKLSNKDKAAQMMGMFEKQIKGRSPSAEIEAAETLRMQWGYMDD